MKTKHLAILATVILTLAISPSPAQNPQVVQQLEARVQQLEAQNRLLQDDYQNKKDDLEANYKQKLDALNIEMREIRQQVREDSLLVKVFTAALVFVGFGIIISAWVSAKIFAEREAEKMIKNVFNAKKEELSQLKDNLLRLIEKQDIEKRLRKTKRILVLTPEGHSKTFLEDFFRESDFQPPYFESFTLADKIDFSNYDVVLFNNDDGKSFSEKRSEIVDTIRKLPAKTLAFYFGGQPNVMLEDTTRFASANFRSQLYGNLINALRYQQDLLSR